MQNETDNTKARTGESALRDITEEELKAVLAGHVQWLDSKKSEGRAASLEGCNLKGAVLLGVNLKSANLRGAFL